MKIRINRRAIIQYLLLYLLLITNSSQIYRLYIDNNTTIQFFIIVVLSVFLITKHWKKSKRAFFLCVFIAAVTGLIRVVQGGIGIIFCFEIIIKVLVIYAAILVDSNSFMTRFIKIVSLFAAISIVGWAQQVIGLDLMTRFASPHPDYYMNVSWETGYRVASQYKIYGILFYTTSQVEAMRNMGFYSEPGIYQMVLNSAILILLFFNNGLDISQRSRKRYLLICIIALILTQSTSGYFGLAVILLGVMMNTANETKSIKNTILLLCVIGVVALFADLSVRGETSLLYKAIISKVFSDKGHLDINASTGMYRMASIAMCIQAMIQNPFGMGIDRWTEFMSTNLLAGPGGWPFKLGVYIGVLPMIVSMVWLFGPLKYIKKHRIAILLIIFLYFNTSLAQTSAFYPVLIMIPVLLSIMKFDIISSKI